MNNAHPLPNKLKFKSVKILVDTCLELTDLDLSTTGLSRRSITYLCSNMTYKLLRINLCGESVRNENIRALVQQCDSLVYLNLCDTKVTSKALPDIVNHLSGSLKDLHLPEKVGLELGLLDTIDMERLRKVALMPHLEFLHIGDYLGSILYRDEHGEVQIEEERHILRMRELFPHLKINFDTFVKERDAILPHDPIYFSNCLENTLTNGGFTFPRSYW